ncbi:MAG: 4-phosphoerythronate dehydrogenase [Bacteroides sp.]|jgi:erythronate-4-phosphate dehydrogenase|nr:4-phosphoerythronate dehydrogenase [Bacteroides sp.]
MLKIVADNKIPFLKGALEPVAQVVYLPGAAISQEDLMDADALIVRTRTLCNARLLEGTSVKFIASATIGHDHIDKDYCQRNNITWTNAPGCNAGSVVQYMSSALGHIIRHTDTSFEKTTLGVIGAGHVGGSLAALARVLGIKTLINDPPRARAEGQGGFCSLEELLEQSDVVSLHVPLNTGMPDKTFHLADKAFFEKMKEGAWFINTSRGEVTETGALIEAIRSWKLSGAIVDVWENEPKIDQELLSLTTVATPHIAGYSADGKAKGTATSVRALSRFFSLGLDGWTPQAIPMPASALLSLPPKVESKEDIFFLLSLQAYNIFADDRALRQDPSSFERLRGDYPIRREPHALKVRAFNQSKETQAFIHALGYPLENER